jgi:protocatechuate 3,4-dioxygenase beta subunit
VHNDDELEDHDRGLSHDLPTLLSRRRALTLLGGAGVAAALAACTSSGTSSGAPSGATAGPASSAAARAASTSASTPSTSTSTTVSSAAAAGTKIPEETAGPFPGDGSNGANVLTESGIVRSDITKSFGTASGVANGVPLTVKLKVLDTKNASAGLQGAAVYVWHCDRDGLYSMYSQGATDENYLRGVQETDGDGEVTFTSIYPAAYTGRWPHIHFEVYPGLAKATTASGKLRTSQLALPEDVCKTVYATDGYRASIANLARTSLATDTVFSDGWSLQLASVTGTVDAGLTARLNVPV